MIDLNHILLFIAVVSPLILLVRIARLRNQRNHGWRIAALIVLAGCAAAWLAVPAIAGFIGGLLWFLLLLVPSLAERKIEDLLLARRWTSARRLAVVRRTFHPWDDSPYRPVLLHSLEQASAGCLGRALDQLAVERNEITPAGRCATALTFALTENWPGLMQWARRDLSVIANPAVLALYFRALGETGALDELVLRLSSRAETREPRLTIDLPWVSNLAMAAACSGKMSSVVRLLQGELRRMPLDEQQFWLATAEFAEGRRDAARERLGRLRLRPVSGAPAVWALILLNVAMFGVETMLGGSTDSLTLQKLGGLDPRAVIARHEYWRLFTALFLHYGALHIGINLLGLYILGPALERTIGAAKFAISYLLSGFGSSAGVVLLWWLGLTKSDLLVGASGCIMGVIGVSAGLLLRHRQSPLAGRQLQNIIVIVVIQTVFDLWSPQVSLAAHLSGFVTGVAIGLVLAARSQRDKFS